MRITNDTASHLVIFVAPKKNNYTLVRANTAVGIGLEGGDFSTDVQWVSDERDENTQRRGIEAGRSELVRLQTRDGAYITVCRELMVGSNQRDVVVGDQYCFVTSTSCLRLTSA